jgi:adenylosuccinate synthase
MSVDVVLGLQWGDEGKGKIVDYLASGYDLVCRFQGGPNAGHTLYINGRKTVLHTLPSGIFHKNMVNLIGNGVVIDPVTLCKEIDNLGDFGVTLDGRLLLCEKAHLILPTHRLLDIAAETAKGETKIGSTLRGIGPTYMDKTGRNGLRIGDIHRADFITRYNLLREKHLGLLKMYPEIDFDLAGQEAAWLESVEFLRTLPSVAGEYYVNEALDRGLRVLAEGAQGTMLDIDFGTYPYVTSSNTVTAGVCTGLGVAPRRIGRVLGITKAYCTRVGSGPFPTELLNEEGDKLRAAGNEFGATTGRPRRCGWIDIPQLKYAMMINGVTDICFTKADVLGTFDRIGICTGYQLGGHTTKTLPFDLDNPDLKPVVEYLDGWNSDVSAAREVSELPEVMQRFIDRLQTLISCPIAFLSTGPEREALITTSDFVQAVH